eukprot:UN02210
MVLRYVVGHMVYHNRSASQLLTSAVVMENLTMVIGKIRMLCIVSSATFLYWPFVCNR